MTVKFPDIRIEDALHLGRSAVEFEHLRPVGLVLVVEVYRVADHPAAGRHLLRPLERLRHIGQREGFIDLPSVLKQHGQRPCPSALLVGENDTRLAAVDRDAVHQPRTASRRVLQPDVVGLEIPERRLDPFVPRLREDGGYEVALKNLKRFNIRLYGTFLYGYDFDTPQSFADSVDFAIGHGFYIAAFNHLTPFPGTPLYQRLEAEGRLVHDAWWLEPSYGYNQIPFRPKNFTPAELQRHCFEARRKFYSYASIARRFANPVNRASFFMARNFPAINLMLRREVQQRDDLPLGHAGWQGDLLPVGAAGGERSSKDLYLAG